MKKLAALCLPLACLLMAASPAAAAGHSKRLPALTPAAPDALSRALQRSELPEAQYALQRARSLFRLGAVRREFGAVARPDPHAATPILRDLAARFRLLSPADRATARRILARPTAPQPGEHAYEPDAQVASACDATRPLCFHWDEHAANRDSPPGADENPATIPAAVTATMTTFAGVWDLEVGTYGYLQPLPDSTSPDDGGDGRTDIYLADVGADGLFGYCTTDDPNAFDFTYPYYDVSAYCVVDEDFANAVYGGIDPQDARDVTAAHEFFHAIQFHYDWFEDLWLMEGTAMLMEGQFRPDVKDRINYLGHSTLTSPGTPVDRGSGGFEYGAWIFWRFLVESMGDPDVGPPAPTPLNPLIIRQIWERADGSSDEDGAGPDTVGPDNYSLQATRKVLTSRGLRFRDIFQKFARVNRFPADFYSEGAMYPRAATARAWSLAARGSTTGTVTTKLRHLSSHYYTLRPGRHTSATATLHVSVDGPNLGAPSAVVILTFPSGLRTVRTIALNESGNGGRTVVFGRGQVRRVDLVLTNRSTRMACDYGTDYSCTGYGLDDLRSYSFRSTVR
jgi:hypothetical protein